MQIEISKMIDNIDEVISYFGRAVTVLGIKNITKSTDNFISFIKESPNQYLQYITPNSIIISSDETLKTRCNLIHTNNPRYVFAQIAATFKDDFLNEECIMGNNVKVGSNCTLKNCIIGNNVIIQSGVIIGEDGFGYVKNEDGSKIIKFPHYGKVIIGDDVTISSNTCIDRGGLNNTIIHRGCKIDNLVHIGHNAIIGENTIITAKCMIAGKIGKNCWVGPSSSTMNGISIADNTYLGMGTVVIKSILNPGEVWVGVPARRIH